MLTTNCPNHRRAKFVSTEQTIGAARAEVLRQTQILRAWRVDTTLPSFEEVRALIARLGLVSG